MNQIVCTLILLLLSGCCTSSVLKPDAASAFSADGLAAIDAAILKAIDEKKMPGGVFRLERNGAVYQKAYGDRAMVPDIEPATTDTIYDAASLTKVIATAPSIMLLVERGKLQLDAPVRKYIPELSGENTEGVTLRHLLTHTSGLRPGLSLSEPWRGYDKGISLAAAETPVNLPGFVFRYSDINYILLGEIVRRAAGVPLAEFAEKEIFVPAGMVDTRFVPNESQFPRIAPTEQSGEEGILRGKVHDPTSRRMGGGAGHAGLFTTAADLSRFARLMLGDGTIDGRRIFAASTVALMTSVQSPSGVTVRRAAGFDIDSPYSRPRGELFPVGSFGHTGWTGTMIWMDPSSKSFYIFLSNRVHPDGKGSVTALQKQLGSLSAAAVNGYDFSKAERAIDRRPGGIVLPTGGASTSNGIDVLVNRKFVPLQGMRIGLITNHTGIDKSLNPTIDLLRSAPGVQLKALFSPEHGIRGVADEKISDSVDEKSLLPVYSLYGETRKPRPEQLRDLDALVFDIQDIGARFYTYISTLALAMEAANEAGIKFFVLDRINPITGTRFEGPVRPDETSFIAYHPIPIRHGMTVGELAGMFREELNMKALDLTVIPIEGWKREYWQDQSGLPWINTSPNMRSLTAATLYPGVCLLERTTMSVGRGTSTPFELIGAPYIDAERFAAALNAASLPGVQFAPERFTPNASVFKGQSCEGARLTLTDRDRFDSVRTGIVIVATLQKLYPESFNLEKVNDLLRHPETIAMIRNDAPIEAIVSSWLGEQNEFETRRAKYLLYK